MTSHRYAFGCEYVTSNIMQKYKKLERVEGERTVNRGVFSEIELLAIFEKATPCELALFGTLSISGPCPGEIYALVDTIYAHTVDSAIAGVSDSVAERVGLNSPAPPTTPTNPPAPKRRPPKLQVIEGGRRNSRTDQRAGRKREVAGHQGRHK